MLLFFASDEVSDSVASVPWWALPAFMSVAAVGFSIRCARWLALCSPVVSGIPATRLLMVYLGGFFMNLTPGRVGELWRAWVLNCGWGIGYRTGLPVVFCERFLDLCAMLAFATLGFGLAPTLTWVASVTGFALAFVVALALFPGWARASLKAAWGMLDKPAPRVFASAQSMLRNLGRILKPSRFATLLALSVAAWSMEAIGIAAFSAVLDVAIGARAGAAVLGASNIAGAITQLPGGIGGQEASMAYMLTATGMNLPGAAALVLLMRVSTLWFSAFLGMPFFLAMTRRHGMGT